VRKAKPWLYKNEFYVGKYSNEVLNLVKRFVVSYYKIPKPVIPTTIFHSN